MKKSRKFLAVLMALVMIITAVPMMTAMAKEEHKHEYVLQEGATEATCTEDGVATYKCACGDVKVAVTKALNHKLVGTYVVKDDIHTKYCDRCKKQVEYEHDYRFEVKVDDNNKAPTCAEVGKQVYRCTCNKKVVKDVEKAAHTFESVIANGDEHVGKCTVCNKTITEAHTWDKGVETKPVKCHADGEMTYTCTACKATKTEKIEAGHDMAEKATSVDAKEHKFECVRTDCGYSKKEAHKFVVTVALASTCSKTGSLIVTCEDCNYVAEETIAKAKHTFGKYEKYDDNKHSQKCEVCKVESYGDHTWDEGKVTKEATCKDEGVKTFTCTACKATKTEAVAKTTEHDWKDWVVVEEATTDKEGKKTRECKVCGATETATINKIQSVPGDVSGDGNITAVDARIILQYVAELRNLNEKEMEAADMNNSGDVTAVDARVILQKVAAGEAE